MRNFLCEFHSIFNAGVEIRPDSCVSCGARGPFKINQSRTEYGNYQRITLQETPGSVPPGRVPRYKEVSGIVFIRSCLFLLLLLCPGINERTPLVHFCFCIDNEFCLFLPSRIVGDPAG